MNPLLDRIPRCYGLKFPGFVTGWMITDLVMTSLHLLVLPFVILFLLMLSLDCFGVYPFWMQFVSSFLLIVFGFTAAIGMLRKRRWAMFFGKVEIAFTLASLLVQLFLLVVSIPVLFVPGAARMVMFYSWFSNLFIFGIRITLLVFYWIAIVRAGKFFRERGC